jgi:Uma2 family endonuclease
MERKPGGGAVLADQLHAGGDGDGDHQAAVKGATGISDRSHVIIAAMEGLIPQLTGRMSEQEYLRMEETAKTKHEYRNGRIIDMAGGTVDHAGIGSSILAELAIRLKGKPCRAYGSDLRVRINESGHYCYPDVTVVCGPVEFAWPDRRTTIVNPKLVIEVTSPSSEADDRGDKFNDYRRVESVEEYALVSQTRAQVETFYRQGDGIWAIGPTVSGLNQSVKFRSIGVEIPLADIYAGIEIPPKPPQNKVEVHPD